MLSDIEWRHVRELIAAVGSAAIAGYVRGSRSAQSWTVARITARLADAVVCGFLTVGIAGYLEWTDTRTTVGLSAALGMVGTEMIGAAVVRLFKARTTGG